MRREEKGKKSREMSINVVIACAILIFKSRDKKFFDEKPLNKMRQIVMV